MNSGFIHARLEDRTWTISIERPTARNAFTPAMYAEMKQAVRSGSACAEASAILIEGLTGAFMVGGDLHDFLELLKAGPEDFRARFEAVYHDPLPWTAILEATKPVVAAIDGYCLAGGLLMVMCCDVAIATKRSRFGIPEAKVGIADRSTVELLVPSIGLMRTRYLALTGRTVDAATAEQWGLITMCVENDALESTVQELLGDLRMASPTSQRAYKRMLNGRIGPMPSDILMDVALSPDGLEGMTAFSEKRQPGWPSLE